MKRGLGVSHGSQECCGNGLGRLKMTHEKGVACFMVPKRGVGRFWEGQERSMKRGVGASWLTRVGWEGLGKAQNCS